MGIKNTIVFNRLLFLVFIVISIFHIISPTIGVDPNLSKPFIILVLIPYYTLATPIYSSVFLIGLFFGWIGDILLMYKSPYFFIYGCISFLIGHLFYIVSFHTVYVRKNQEQASGKYKFITLFIVALVGGSLLYKVILPNVQSELKIPVVAYSIVLMAMVSAALLRYKKTTSISFYMIVIGSIFFMFSDIMLALNKFITPLSRAHEWVLTTYILAQILIVRGTFYHKETTPEQDKNIFADRKKT